MKERPDIDFYNAGESIIGKCENCEKAVTIKDMLVRGKNVRVSSVEKHREALGTTIRSIGGDEKTLDTPRSKMELRFTVEFYNDTTLYCSDKCETAGAIAD